MATPILLVLMLVSLTLSIQLDAWWIEIPTAMTAGFLAVTVGERIDEARPVKAGERS